MFQPKDVPLSQDLYCPDSVLRALTVPHIEGCPQIFRALYLPSFHPEVLISIALGSDGGGEIVMTSFEASLWFSLSERLKQSTLGLKIELLVKRGLKELEPPELPGCWVERAGLPRELGERLRIELGRALHRIPKSSGRRFGVDGISLLGEVSRSGDERLRFEAWSPRQGDPDSDYFVAVHRIAFQVLEPDRARCRLEQLHGYLDLGLSVKDLGGVPRLIRVLGWISTSEEDALRAFLSAFPPDEPLIIDLTNFEGIGAGLYPALRSFRSRPGRIAWVASSANIKQLHAIGIPREEIFADVVSGTSSITDKR